MKISVIMPSYLGEYEGAAANRKEKFKRSVESFINQQFINCELIIVADGCEETAQTLYSMNLMEPSPDFFVVGEQQDILLRKIPKQAPFAGAVRNAGIEAATGDIICYLDIDDLLLRGHLQAIFHGFFPYPGREAEYRRWAYFNDYIAGPDLQPIHERQTHLRYGGIGTGGFAHEKSLGVAWPDGYGHDWLLVERLMQVCPHTRKVTGPRYLVCHLPPNIDY